MADSVTKKYIYPPGWEEGTYDDTQKGHKKYIVNLTCVSDGTGETDVKKIDLSNFLTTNGDAATKFVIEEIDAIGWGFSYILLEFDRAPQSTIAVIGDTAKICYEGGLTDPDDTGGTGDIVLTTSGATAGDTYNLTITFRVKNDNNV